MKFFCHLGTHGINNQDMEIRILPPILFFQHASISPAIGPCRLFLLFGASPCVVPGFAITLSSYLCLEVASGRLEICKVILKGSPYSAFSFTMSTRDYRLCRRVLRIEPGALCMSDKHFYHRAMSPGLFFFVLR